MSGGNYSETTTKYEILGRRSAFICVRCGQWRLLSLSLFLSFPIHLIALMIMSGLILGRDNLAFGGTPQRWMGLAQFILDGQFFEAAKPVAPECGVETQPIDQRSQPLRLDAVVGLAPLTAVADEADEPEGAQMLRHRRLRYAGEVGQRVDGLLAVAA